MSFTGKVVIVTGAGSGIGAATAKLFAKEGASVVIVDINKETAQESAEICKQFGYQVLAIEADLTKAEDARRIISTTIENFGKLDVLVNNAGVLREGTLLSGDIMESYDLTMNTNLRAVILMTSLAVQHLVETKGCIVNTSSACTKTVKMSFLSPVYGASKAGIDSFTKVSALELSRTGVRVNAVNPGPVFTNIAAHSGRAATLEKQKPNNNYTALGKIADPHEIADLTAYLASDKAKSITGSCYEIDNGMGLI